MSPTKMVCGRPPCGTVINAKTRRADSRWYSASPGGRAMVGTNQLGCSRQSACSQQIKRWYVQRQWHKTYQICRAVRCRARRDGAWRGARACACRMRKEAVAGVGGVGGVTRLSERAGPRTRVQASQVSLQCQSPALLHWTHSRLLSHTCPRVTANRRRLSANRRRGTALHCHRHKKKN